MTIRFAGWASAAFCALQLSMAAPVRAQSLPQVYTLDPQALAAAKQAVEHKAPTVVPAYRKLMADADKALSVGPMSVVDKGLTPPSGDKHDYLSMGPYWWPDPSKPDGKPYIRRDGRINPSAKNNDTDSRRIETFSDTVGTLGFAYYFSGDKRYADHAALLLRTWFLAPATRMNPNLNYAQAVLGVNNGRGTGIIDTRHFWEVIDTIGLISPSGALSADEQSGLKRWFAEYTKWMMTSANGHDEADATNNHGTYFDEQVANQARYVGDDDLARQIANEAMKKRIEVQIAADGRQPMELERTRAFHYSVFNLQAFMRLAHHASAVGVDLWRYPNAGSPALGRAVGYLSPFVLAPASWPYKDIQGIAYADYLPVYLQARLIYGPSSQDADIINTLLEKLPRAREWLYWPVGTAGADGAAPAARVAE
ncbi:alginate lyase family protein [Pandoraea anhela]|uniref:Alginate lyase n=1 Tax=Pandoraea anhela TaxID=2508295 RepID=A0A5E4WEV7_9BURK|nr:alginate lyase family protein [Pandoraea anhela]VVE21565.1 alginate lyase [Pandoraea anhela]